MNGTIVVCVRPLCYLLRARVMPRAQIGLCPITLFYHRLAVENV
jgi:hypothetical protein